LSAESVSGKPRRQLARRSIDASALHVMTKTAGIVTTHARGKRPYSRRSDDERIADLQAKIDELQGRIKKKERKDLPVLREVPRIQARLRKFVQLALDHGRHDLANSAMAYVAGLERALEDVDMPRRRRGAETGENGESDED
jgi:hypothetical protein